MTKTRLKDLKIMFKLLKLGMIEEYNIYRSLSDIRITKKKPATKLNGQSQNSSGKNDNKKGRKESKNSKTTSTRRTSENTKSDDEETQKETDNTLTEYYNSILPSVSAQKNQIKKQ